MSDNEQPAQPEDGAESDLGPMPEAQIEPGEPNPGGVDAVPDSDGVDGEAADGEPLARDLDPEDNPVTDEVPLEVKTGEDTSTEATEGDGTEAASQDDDAVKESPA